VTLNVMQKDRRRVGHPVEFPLTDDRGEIVTQNRRRLPDRRLEKYDHNALKIIPALYKLAIDLVDGVRGQFRNRL